MEEEWNRLKKHKNSSIIEPEDKGDLHTTLGRLSDNLQERSLQVKNYLNTLDLPESKWSGRTISKSDEVMGRSSGKKVKSCDIWFRSDASVKTVIHEHLHARSISRTPTVYGKWNAIEEAVVEMLSEEICKKHKISYMESYKKETGALRNAANVLGNSDYYEFSRQLIHVDADKRKD